MKNIPKQFTLNNTTYLFFFLAFLCGYFKQVLLIFIIILWHELGHVSAITYFHYKIEKIELYPFGGITTIRKPINSSIAKEMMIAISGVGAQLLLELIFLFLFHHQFLSEKIYLFCHTYNFTIFFFNLLPIIPLDGSVFLHAFLEKFFPYKKAFQYYERISVVSFLLFFFVNIVTNLHNFFICMVLFIQFLLLKRKEKYLLNRFYLERYLYEYPYFKIENEEEKNIDVLKKETLHFFKEGQRYIHEKELLKRHFS